MGLGLLVTFRSDHGVAPLRLGEHQLRAGIGDVFPLRSRGGSIGATPVGTVVAPRCIRSAPITRRLHCGRGTRFRRSRWERRLSAPITERLHCGEEQGL